MEPDYRVKVYWTTPNDPNYSMQWHHPKIQSSAAWDYNTGGATVKVWAWGCWC